MHLLPTVLLPNFTKYIQDPPHYRELSMLIDLRLFSSQSYLYGILFVYNYEFAAFFFQQTRE